MNTYESYIVIPKNVDRNDFVKRCLNNNEVAIGNPYGSYRIAKDAASMVNDNDGIISTLDFPATYKEIGSKVIVLELPYFKIPLVFLTGNVKNRFTASEEKQIKLFKQGDDNNNGLIDIRGLKGIMDLSVLSNVENGGKINIEAINNNKDIDSEIKIKANVVNHIVTILNTTVENYYSLIIRNSEKKDGFMELKYELETGLSFIDEFNNQIIQIEDYLQLLHQKKIIFGDGNEPLLLGDTTVDFMKDFLETIRDTYAACTVPTALGLSGTPVNAPTFVTKINDLLAQINEIKSQYTFTD